MKTSLVVLMVLGVSLAFWGCSQDPVLAPGLDQSEESASTFESVSAQNNQAASAFKAASTKPAPNLKGTMALDRNLDWVFQPDNPEYNETVPVWEGTVTFENFDDPVLGNIFGMRFFHLSPKKGYSQASPFVERFEIYDRTDPTIVYLAGPDEGLTTLANMKYRMNGEIDVATGPFAMWLGRNVHMMGDILSHPDGTKTAPGEFRVN